MIFLTKMIKITDINKSAKLKNGFFPVTKRFFNLDKAILYVR